MQGHRLADGEFASDPFRPGTYGRVQVDGEWEWRCCTPNGHAGNLNAHDVVEHDDGTITVSPSIQILGGQYGDIELWHGYLKAGVWTCA